MQVLASIGQLEFFYDQAPDVMRSCSMALQLLSVAAGSYLSGQCCSCCPCCLLCRLPVCITRCVMYAVYVLYAVLSMMPVLCILWMQPVLHTMRSCTCSAEHDACVVRPVLYMLPVL